MVTIDDLNSPAHVGRGRRISAVPRSRGALTGVLLLLLGAWGCLAPMLGPYFDYSFAPDSTWTLTSARLFLQVLPGAVTFVGALLLLGAKDRFTGMLGAVLALASGLWFVVGPLLAPLFRQDYLGQALGSDGRVATEQIGLFFGLGAVIVLLAALALGRLTVVGVRDVATAQRRADRRAEVAAEQEQAAREQAAADRAAETRTAETRAAETRTAETRATASQPDTGSVKHVEPTRSRPAPRGDRTS